MGTPHKHADLIKAWADGAEIQGLSESGWRQWIDVATPLWLPALHYRIKPKPVHYLVILCSFEGMPEKLATISACGETQVEKIKAGYVHPGSTSHKRFIKILHEGVIDGI